MSNEKYINDYSDKNRHKSRLSVIAFEKVYTSKHDVVRFVEIPDDCKLNSLYHIDVMIWHIDGTFASFDVKDNMTSNANGDDCIVVEIRNNSGREFSGSLYGRQLYFAIMQKNHDDIFWIINRKKLLKFIENANIENKFVDKLEDATYKKYSRKHENKNDELTIIPIDDLLNAGIVSQIYLES